MPVFIMLAVSVQVAVCRLLGACIHAWLRMCAMHLDPHIHVTSQRHASLQCVECAHTKLGTGVCMYIRPRALGSVPLYYIYALDCDHLYHLCYLTSYKNVVLDYKLPPLPISRCICMHQ